MRENDQSPARCEDVAEGRAGLLEPGSVGDVAVRVQRYVQIGPDQGDLVTQIEVRDALHGSPGNLSPKG